MKSFTQFSENLQQRREMEAERRRAQIAAQKERVSEYQQTQAANREQRQNEIETTKRRRMEAQRIAELERTQQRLQQQIQQQQQQAEELQLEQIPNMSRTAENESISKRQRSDKATLRKLTLAAKRSALRSYNQHHLDLLGKIMSR